MQGLFGAIGSDRGPFDRAVAHHRSRQRSVEVLRDGHVRLAVVGSAGRTLAQDTDADSAVAVAGSSAELLDLARVRDGRLDHGDAVALIARSDTLHSITGSGQTRLLRWTGRDGNTFLCTDMATMTAGVDCRVDRSWEDFLLGFGFLPDNRTMFDDVVVTAPARTVDEGGGAETSAQVSPPPEIQRTGDIETDLLSVLEQSILERAAGQRRHAVLLGGFDSALVCAVLRRAGHEVSGFTYAFADAPSMNQRNIDTLVDALGIDHHWVEIGPEVIDEGLRSIDERLNLPSAQPHYQLHTVHACEVVRDAGFDLAFTGDGCDAAFLGYPTVNQRARLSTFLERVPGPLVKGGLAVAGASVIEDRAGHVSRVTRSVLHSAMLGAPASGHLPTRYLDERSLDRLRAGDNPRPAEEVDRVRRRLAEAAGDLDPTRLAFHGQALSGASRVKVEGAVNHTGVAIWSPYNDPRLRALAADIPTERLRPGGSAADSLGKSVLIDAVRASGLLPGAVIDQPKQSPATSPIDRWLTGPLRPTVFELLEGLPFDWDRSYVESLLSPKRIEDLYRRKVTLSRHVLQAVGILVSYAAFARRAT